ncbi:NADPH-dependent FMN reductase [Gallibacterium genomosp. 2]|uniref:NADPH-dependent FMN reductase n=1 Tax=Gallibacterium genomosp. 2 TaxID=155517 RepID=A0A0A2XTB6_9PAST|nr:NAD(P)H-dependent oxidoreductase [Gallibacterium genomosp. 2]KGQ34297.1 NADPH-dependent FMN reductase [Gallibacterium genomosp. 2]
MKIALIVGSLSKRSLNRHIANQILKFAPENVEIEEIDISNLPLYSQDLDEIDIPSYNRIREQIKCADAILISSPEHNRTIPAALKNVIDIATRPYGQNVWLNKKVAIVTASPGVYGGINAGLDLRKVLTFVGAEVLSQPEVYLSKASFDLDERTTNFLKQFAQRFFQWVENK